MTTVAANGRRVRVRVYQGPTLSQGAAIALRARLYVSGWCLSRTLGEMRDRPRSGDLQYGSWQVAIAWVDDQPVAVATRFYNEIMAFTRKSARGAGLGRACVQALDRTDLVASEGVKGSRDFWSKVGIHCY